MLDGEIVGTLTYDGGDIGVFVADGWNDRGIGDTLLGATDGPLRIEIFARNPSRAFYRANGFLEDGPEGRHHFSDSVWLPTQVLRRGAAG